MSLSVTVSLNHPHVQTHADKEALNHPHLQTHADKEALWFSATNLDLHTTHCHTVPHTATHGHTLQNTATRCNPQPITHNPQDANKYKTDTFA